MGPRGWMLYNPSSSTELTSPLKVPRTEAAFPLWTANAIRCRKNAVDLGSFVETASLLPINDVKCQPSVPHAPDVSMAMGMKVMMFDRFAYFSRFADSAFAAADPASVADELRWDWANVSGHVASQATELILLLL